jgi:hypothetical protein
MRELEPAARRMTAVRLMRKLGPGTGDWRLKQSNPDLRRAKTRT